MDEEAVPGPAASPDPGYHDDDELAAALAAQLDRVIETTGSVPLQRDGAAPDARPAATSPGTPVASSTAPPAVAPAPPPRTPPGAAAEPPLLTGPLKSPAHRAAAVTTDTGPVSAASASEHHPEHRAERSTHRGAHRSDPDHEAHAEPALPVPASGAEQSPSTAPVPSAFGPAASAPMSNGPREQPAATDSVPSHTGSLPLDTGSFPLSRRARRAEERARAQAGTASVPVEQAPSELPRTEPVTLPGAARPAPGEGFSLLSSAFAAATRATPPVLPQPAESARSPEAVPERPAESDEEAARAPSGESAETGAPAAALRAPAVLGPPVEPLVEDAEPAPGPVRHRRSFLPPPESHPDAAEALPEETDAMEPAAAAPPSPVEHEHEAEAPAVAPSPAHSEAWGRALRLVDTPAREDEAEEEVDAPAPAHAGPWFEQPRPTTGTVVLSGAPTEPVPVAEPDDGDAVDEVESGYHALAADTASVGLLPPLVDEAGRHVVPSVSRGSLDRDRLPEAVTEERPSRALRSGPLAPLATWAGAVGSPLAIVVGFALGGGAGTVLGLVLGLALALPAVVRLGAVGARTGRDAVTAARASLGEEAGVAAGLVLLVGRVAIAAFGLLGVAEIATSYAGRTGLGGALPASGAAILAVLLAGLLSLAVGVWPGRIVGVVLGAAGAVALFVSAAMLVILAGTAGTPASTAASPLPAAVAGFALVGLVVASGAAEVTRRPLAAGRRGLPVVGSVLGAAAAAGVIALGGAAAGGAAGGGGATDAFVGALVDATSVALVGPIAVLLLLSALALVATVSRAAGTAAVSLLDRGRSTGLGTAAATLVAIAVALAALAGGLDGSGALVRFGPLVGVPLTAVLAALTVAPVVRRGAGRAPLLVLGVAVLLGWLLVDHLLVPTERSPLLDLVGLTSASDWRATPALGLLVAAVGGAVAGGLARSRSGPPKDDATERLPAMETATPE